MFVGRPEAQAELREYPSNAAVALFRRPLGNATVNLTAEGEVGARARLAAC